jgi:hypothetical protein
MLFDPKDQQNETLDNTVAESLCPAKPAYGRMFYGYYCLFPVSAVVVRFVSFLFGDKWLYAYYIMLSALRQYSQDIDNFNFFSTNSARFCLKLSIIDS